MLPEEVELKYLPRLSHTRLLPGFESQAETADTVDAAVNVPLTRTSLVRVALCFCALQAFSSPFSLLCS